MKSLSVFFERPGKVELREIEVADPGEGEVQVRCLANGICMFEVSVFTGVEPISRFENGQAGHEGIGVVTKVGPGVKKLREGDCVPCFSWLTAANIKTERLFRFSRVPADPAIYISEPPSCVVTAARSYDIAPGDRVLVLGAGFMGLLNVQALAHYPLAELVVSDIKPANLELAKRFGATETIRSDSPQGRARLEELRLTPFDLVVEASGAVMPMEQAGDLTRPGGRLGIFAWHHQPRMVDLGLWHMKGIRVLNAAPGIGLDYAVDPFERAIRLLERGVFDLNSLVTHRHPLEKVQEALEIAAERPADYIKGVLEFGRH